MLSGGMALVPTLMLFPYELNRAQLAARVVERATGDAVEQVSAYADAGGQVLFGTDVGYMTDYDPTEEYRLMARALTPLEILASLTTAPADPAADPANLAKVRCTIRQGRLSFLLD
jgi:2-methylisocitrate lyase-like PEP mutase family enzyme